MNVDLARIKKVHIIGIKGAGVVAVVEILQALGVQVNGSDTEEKFFTDEVLKNLGIKYTEGFSEKNIPEDTDLVIYSTAYNAENNVEFKFAQEKGILRLSYPEVLALLFNQRYGIAVTGTHGKTTTSAILASVLKFCDADPMAVIGSRVKEWESNALIGKGEYFVIEADEYQNKLKLYQPKGAIVTSLDFDHPDTFKDFSEYKKAFSDFVEKIFKAGFAVVCGDDANVLDVSKDANCEVLSYGFSQDCDFQIADYKLTDKKQSFKVKFHEKDLGEFEISLVGKHNVSNVVSVIAVCQKLNLDLEKVREALKVFQGITRRFEFIGERKGAILIDDYGHHPEEIKVTLKGAREIYPEKKIIAIFQPHSYSRTEALLEDFAQSFDNADEVIVLDIYGSAREYSGDVSSKELADLINKYDHEKAHHLPVAQDAVHFLQDRIGDNDVVICIGAGNGREVAEKLKQ